MSSHETLSAAASDRKARLAQLKSLKRKQAPSEDGPSVPATEDGPSASPSMALARTEEEPSVTTTYLSGRNFDPATRNVKLGFDATPVADATKTLEYKAEQLALESKQQQDKEKREEKPLDLFKLQPKKPNWDLKRDLEAKMRPLDVQTENAIARLVRDRVEAQKLARTSRDANSGDSAEKQEVGMEGSELVEAMHLKEKEEEEERKRDADEDDIS